MSSYDQHILGARWDRTRPLDPSRYFVTDIDASDSASLANDKFLAPKTPTEMFKEWNEIGKTGSTDGYYGESEDSLKRRRGSELVWLAKHWGIERRSILELTIGSISRGTFDYYLQQLMKICPKLTRDTLKSTKVVSAALQSNCSSTSATFQQEKQYEMVKALMEYGFRSSNVRVAASVASLMSQVDKKNRERAKSKRISKAKMAALKARIHPGRLETFKSDMSGLDSTEMRHMPDTYQQWSCCHRGPNAHGCQPPRS